MKAVRKRVVFVCIGNTCRSPMAESIFNSLCRQNNIKWRAASAGVCAREGGKMSANAAAALRALSVPANTRFKSRLLTKDLVEANTLIVCMNKYIAERAAELTYGDPARITVLGAGIPDPYGESVEVYINTARKIFEECVKLVQTIISGEAE